MFAIPPRERDLYYQAVKNVWIECKSSRDLCISTLVTFSYLTDMAQSVIGRECILVQKVAGAEYHVASLGAFLRGAQYGPIERLA